MTFIFSTSCHNGPTSCSLLPCCWRPCAKVGVAHFFIATGPFFRALESNTRLYSKAFCVQVYIIGEEAKIDQKLSLPWLRDRTAAWTWKTHILPSPTKWVHPHLV